MFFIDGFNFYHALKEKQKYHKYLWLNYLEFASSFLRSPDDSLAGVLYFSALPSWDQKKKQRHLVFIRALQHAGVTIIMSRFKEKTVFCKVCHNWFKANEEKQTDVSIGVYLFREAHLDRFDRAVLVTNDTDLVPAIKVVKETFPEKKIGVLFPIERHSTELQEICDFRLYTKRQHLKKSQFPDPLVLPSGKLLSKPPSWK